MIGRGSLERPESNTDCVCCGAAYRLRYREICTERTVADANEKEISTSSTGLILACLLCFLLWAHLKDRNVLFPMNLRFFKLVKTWLSCGQKCPKNVKNHVSLYRLPIETCVRNRISQRISLRSNSRPRFRLISQFNFIGCNGSKYTSAYSLLEATTAGMWNYWSQPDEPDGKTKRILSMDIHLLMCEMDIHTKWISMDIHGYPCYEKPCVQCPV